MYPSVVAAVLLAAVTGLTQPAPPAPPPPSVSALAFLVGEWDAAGAGEPGRSTGRFTFEWAAGGRALLRRNEAETPGGVHTDVMLVVRQGPDLRAVYADSEGHTIDYAVTISTEPEGAVFESAGPGPRFRLWYRLEHDGSLATGFEVAPAGSGDFQTYLEGVAHRRRLQ